MELWLSTPRYAYQVWVLWRWHLYLRRQCDTFGPEHWHVAIGPFHLLRYRVKPDAPVYGKWRVWTER